MTDKPTDTRIDRLVKARWLEIGISHADLAELLDAACQPNDADASTAIDVARLTRVAKALNMSAEFLRGRDGATTAEQPGQAAQQGLASQQSLLQLRLLRAFCGLSDQRAQRMLVYLAEQLSKCKASPPKDAG